MAELLIRPGKLRGDVIPPPSKSDAHRALIAAGIAGGLDAVSGLPDIPSDDILATRRCLRALSTGRSMMDCGESGTTLRLMIPVVAAIGAAADTAVTFIGSGRLTSRPLAEYQTILAGHGVELVFPPGASLPLCLKGRLRAGTFEVPGHISSQYISGLLFALPILKEDSLIRLTSPLESAPYVAMSLRTLKAFGISVISLPDGYRVPGGQTYQPVPYHIEKDYSQAAFWLTAAFSGSQLTVSGLNMDSVQGDKAILDLLADFKRCRPEYTIDAANIPDLVPILSVAAALTPSRTRIVHASRLRLKESDRLQSTRMALRAIGADLDETDDGLLIIGRQTPCLEGGTADSFSDHRIAMALAIAALSTCRGIRLRGAEAINKSYPDFFREFRRLGGDLDELHLGTSSENQLIW